MSNYLLAQSNFTNCCKRLNTLVLYEKAHTVEAEHVGTTIVTTSEEFCTITKFIIITFIMFLQPQGYARVFPTENLRYTMFTCMLHVY